MKKAGEIRVEGKIAEMYAHILAQRKQRIRRTVAMVLASVMLFSIVIQGLETRGLSLENKPFCGQEEHIHTEECMQIMLSCSEEEQEPVYALTCSVRPHTHDTDCYDSEGKLICGQADYLIHKHSSLCYDADGLLVCALAVQEEHIHNDACTQTVKDLICALESCEGHTHTAECYTLDPQELVCGLEESAGHVHGEECYSESNFLLVCSIDQAQAHAHTDDCYAFIRDSLICGLEEGAVHIHTESCMKKTLTCTQAESDEHTHSAECYNEEYICGASDADAAHHHKDACYSYQRILVCGLEESAEAHLHTAACFVESEKELLCQVPEGTGAHHHTPECYQNQVLVLSCEKAEQPGHQHTDTCYAVSEKTICGLNELHTHSDSCYPNGDRNEPPICGKPELKEHVHDGSCLTLVDAGHTHEAECYTEVCVYGKSEHLHHSGCYIPGSTSAEPAQSLDEDENTPEIPDSEGSNNAEDLVGTNDPENTDEKNDPNEPEDLDDPSDTEKPEITSDPSDTEKPEITDDPSDTEKPEITDDPSDTEKPEITSDPSDMEKPEITDDPSDMEKPEITDDPSDTEKPEITDDLPDIGQAEIVDTTEGTAEIAAPEMSFAMAFAPAALFSAVPPLDAEEFIKPNSVKLSYKTENDSDFHEYTGAVLPGNATLRMEFDLENVPIDRLRDANGVMQFNMPEFMRASVRSQLEDASGNVVAVIDINGNVVSVQFTEEYMDSAGNGNVDINNFYVEAELDLKWIDENHPGQLVIGDTSIGIAFENDLVSRYGNTTVEKSAEPKLIQTGGKSYAEYTITVTADEFGCPNVTIVDHFTLNSECIDRYEGINGTPKPAASVNGWNETGVAQGSTAGLVYLGTVSLQDGTAAFTPDANSDGMIWEIGDMQPNESRTLTYRVRVKESKVGAEAPRLIRNNVQQYSNGIPRTETMNDLALKSGAGMNKSCYDVIDNPDGTVTLKYLVTLTANSDNSYNLKNVHVRDGLDIPRNSNEANDPLLLQYLSLEADSIQAYKGKVNVNRLDRAERIADAQIVVDASSGKNFTCTVGELAPGDSISIVYDVTVEPGFFAQSGNHDGIVNNVAKAYCGGEDRVAEWNPNNYWSQKSLEHVKWSRKVLADEKTEAPEVIRMNSGTIHQGTDTEFTVPAGSYKYAIIVNEQGEWDVSRTTLTDSLFYDYMYYIGYVRVDLFDGVSINSSDTEDTAAIDHFSGQTPLRTAWVKVDGLQSFRLKPENLGFESGNYAIRLTYYTGLDDDKTPDKPEFGMKNSFALSGTVGYGDVYYPLGGTMISSEATVSKGAYFKVEKQGWYCDRNPDWITNDHDGIYWIIRVDADSIDAGTSLKDETITNGSYKCFFLDNGSYVGAFIGSRDLNLSGYSSWEAVQDLGCLTDISDKVTGTKVGAQEMRFTFNEKVDLDGEESVYIIVRTEINSKLSYTDAGNYFFASNKISHSFDGNVWTPDNTANLELTYSNGIIKTCDGVIKWDGTHSEVVSGKDIGAGKNYLTEPGTYVQWFTKVNPYASYEGDFIITDTIPDGMELSYLYLSWRGPVAVNNSVGTKQLSGMNGWTEHVSTVSGITNYYYTKGNQVCWCVTNLQKYSPALSTVRNRYSVTFEIICRVTDMDTLLSGEQKQFTNTISISDLNGNELGRDSYSQPIQTQTMSKSKDTSATVGGGVYPFVLALNSLGEDLVPGGDTVTLVDTMSSTLKLDLDSIRVEYKHNGTWLPLDPAEYVVDINVENGQDTMRITLPDSKALKVYYSTFVQAEPDQEVSISNNAYWEGYASSTGSSIKEEKYKYSAGGSVSNWNVKLRIVKRNQDNVAQVLPGASFTVREMALGGGGIVPAPGGQVWEDQLTNGQGVISINSDTLGNSVKPNTIYEIIENKAPDGFVTDPAPHYFAVAYEGKDGYENLAAYRNAGVTIYYQGEQYTYNALNQKAAVTVTKQFEEDGNPIGLQDGEYTFGLYKTGEDTPILTKTLVIENGRAKNAVVFDALDEDVTYFIRELNEAGEPMGEDISSLRGSYFSVSYDGNNNDRIEFTPENPEVNVTVTNNEIKIMLPETGGMGTAMFTISGLVMMMVAAMLFALRRREEQ